MSRRSLALYYYSVQPPARAHNGTTTRWRLNSGNQEADTRIKVASFLWRVSGKIGNIASRMETKNQEAKSLFIRLRRAVINCYARASPQAREAGRPWN
jgi:hypothetical protein